MADYENITNPYDNTLARQPGGLSFAAGGQNIDSGVAQQSQAAAQAGGNTAASSSVGGGPAQQASVASGGAIADITIEHSIQSKNWSPKKVGFYIDGQTGYAEFSNVFVSGDIQALTGTIGGWTINATTLTGGNATLGSTGVLTLGTTNDVVIASAVDATYRIWVGHATAASAPFSVTKAGAVAASNITITGGAVSGVPISSIPNSTVTDISILEMSHDLVFSVTDADTIAWALGTIIMSNGRTFSISAGNTGNMAALTYIYLDPAVSSTVLQTTTTYSTAMGANKRLIGTAQNNTVTASYIPYGPGKPLIDGANIGALSIVAGNIAASTITAGKMSVSTLSSIVADIGTITAGSISVVNGGNTIGLTPAGTNAIFSGTTGSPEFKVTPAGAMTASNATITGSITGSTITGSTITTGTTGANVNIELSRLSIRTGTTEVMFLELGTFGGDLGINNASGTPIGLFQVRDGSNNLNIGLNAPASTSTQDIFITAGRDVYFANSNTTTRRVLPGTDNAISLGLSANRWSDVRSVLINGADYGFEHHWYLTENYKIGIKEEGIAVLNSKNDLVLFIGEKNLYVRGGDMKNVDDLPYIRTTLEERAHMDMFYDERYKDKDGEKPESLEMPDDSKARKGGARYIKKVKTRGGSKIINNLPIS